MSIERLENRVLFSTYWVTNTNDSGSGSLRAAIQAADSAKTIETIDFAIGSGSKTLTPHSALPHITKPTVIDATTQPGYAGKPLIELNGSSAGTTDGLEITAGGTTIKGLVINRFKGNGILAVNFGNNIIQGNYLGTDISGSVKEANSGDGVLLGGANNIIGGTTSRLRNVISGNGNMGVFLCGPSAGKNTVQGNYIGVNAAGSGALGNKNNGLDIKNEPSNLIGGTIAGAGNVISGNGQDGIILFGTANYNTIQGNLIGTDSTGTKSLGNLNSGIENQTSHNLIGGTTAGARNVLSGNTAGCGIICWGYVSQCIDNTIIGNFVGTDITGTKALPNWGGVVLSDNANQNIVGGTSAADRNIISGNSHVGLGFYQTSNYNVIAGNYIGTDVTGKKAVANHAGIGVFNNSVHNTIGGSSSGAGNVIAGNAVDGIDIGSSYTTVQGNVLGLTGSSTATPKNLGTDLFVLSGSVGNVISKNV